MADFKGLFIEYFGILFVLLGAINASTKDGIPGLTRLGDYLINNLGFDKIGEILKFIGQDFGTAFLIFLGALFLMYRGRWIFGILRKYLPVK